MIYRFKNEAEALSVKIYDTIGDDGWGDGITAKDIDEILQNGKGKPLNVYINSYGGDVFEGFAIYNMLKRYNGEKTVYVDGIAASIASVIAMAGDKVVMGKASMMMIHNASSWAWGTAEDMKKVVQALEEINSVIKDIYQTRTTLSEESLTALMDEETFISAEKCLEYGFADEILETELAENTYSNMIESLNEMKDNVEKSLKMFNDIKNLDLIAESESGGNPVVEEEEALNKKHWDWMKGGII